jgi:hypothetical protein
MASIPFITGISSRAQESRPITIPAVPIENRFALEYRVESFNLTNTPVFAQPNSMSTRQLWPHYLNAEYDETQVSPIKAIL